MEDFNWGAFLGITLGIIFGLGYCGDAVPLPNSVD